MTYIPDFQHKYMPDFFSEEEIRGRDTTFAKQCMENGYVMVTSFDTKNDILKYFPNHICKIYVQPFAPICMTEWIEDIDINFSSAAVSSPSIK